MKIEDFIKKVLIGIELACKDSIDSGIQVAPFANCVEFNIQINDKGEVCKHADTAVCTLTIRI